jgi:hypothetical protein
LPGRGVNGERDQVRFRIVALGQIAVRVAAGGVEIAQYGEAQPFRGTRIENLLAGELGAPVSGKSGPDLWPQNGVRFNTVQCMQCCAQKTRIPPPP